MQFTSAFKPSMWEVFIDKYFNTPNIVSADTGDFTFAPSDVLITELKNSFTNAKLEKYENGPTFSSYYVKYDIGGHKGDAIYKTTTTIYPDFIMYDTVEEYKMSFAAEYN